MNNLNPGAFCPPGGDNFMPLLMMMTLCPQMFGGGAGDNTMTLLMLMLMTQGGGRMI